MTRPVLLGLEIAIAFVLGCVAGSVGGVGVGHGDDAEPREFDSPGFSLSKSVGARDDPGPDS